MILSVDNQQHLELLNFQVIKKEVIGKHPSVQFEHEFVRRITMINQCLQREEARLFFLGDYSSPILSYVVRYVYCNESYQELLGEYYEFISKRNKNISYYKLTLYSNFNNSTLRNYVTAITVRHFVDVKKKEDSIDKQTISIDGAYTIATKENEKDVIENPWFNLLIGNSGNSDENSLSAESYKKIEYVFSKLPERDVKIIKLMVMDNVSGLEAFEELEADLKETAKTPISTWSTKQKQNAMALLKGRALKHFKKITEDETINF